MNYHITHGTDDYLKKVMEKYKKDGGRFYLLEHSGDAALMHVTSGKNRFESGQSYEPVEESGNLDEASFIVFNHIPVDSDKREIFEDRFKQRAGLVDKEPGCTGVAVLRPKDSETYIVISTWKDERDFENWRGSESFEKAHEIRENVENMPRSMFSSKPYVKSYHIIASA